MKKLNKILFALMLALVGGGISCVDDIKDVVAPKLTVSETQLLFSNEGGSLAFEVEANCAWTVNNSDPDWVTVEPTEGYGNEEITVFVPETSKERTATISFTLISSDYGRWGKAEQMVTVHQYPGEIDPDFEEQVIYHNEFDAVPGATSSPFDYLDACTDSWQDHTGAGIANVTYSSNGASLRNNSNSNSTNYSDYAGSGTNNIFFGRNAYFTIEKIDITASNKLKLTFGAEKFLSNGDSTFNPDEFTVTLSANGTDWSNPIEYTFPNGYKSGRWDFATANFMVPEGTEELYIKFTALVESAYRLDDVTLSTGMGGDEIDLVGGGSGDGGNEGDDPSIDDDNLTDYLSQSAFVPSANNSDMCYYPLTGDNATTINNQEASGIKFGTSSKAGVYTTDALGVTGDKYLSFYGFAWNNASATIYIGIDGDGSIENAAAYGISTYAVNSTAQVKVNTNSAVAGNTGFAITATAADYYVFKITGMTESTKITLSTSPDFSTASSSTGNRAVLARIRLTDEKIGPEEGDSGDTPADPTTIKIADVKDGATATVEGTVLAVHSKGVLIGDDSGMLLCFFNGYATEYLDKVGYKVTASGKGEDRYNFMQFSEPTLTFGDEDKTLDRGTAKTIDAAAAKSFAEAPAYTYAKLTGKLNITTGTSYNTYTLTVDGITDYTIQMAYGIDSYYDGLKTGDEVVVEGYLIGYNDNTKQISVMALKVSKEGDAEEPGDEYEFEGDGSEENPYTVADVQYKWSQDPNYTENNVWVTGEITGWYTGKNFKSDVTSVTDDYNVALGNASETCEYPVCVQVTSNFRTTIGLQSKPGNMGKKLTVYGNIAQYNSVPGVKNGSVYNLEGDDEPTQPEVKTEGEGTVENPYTGNDVQELYKNGYVGKDEAKDIWVSGTIIGYYEGTTLKTEVAATTYARAYNFISSYSESKVYTIENNIVIEDAKGAQIPVFLPESSKWRADLNLKDHPTYLKTEIAINGDITEFNDQGGIELSDAKYEAPAEDNYEFDGKGTLDEPYSVADAIYLYTNEKQPTTEVWVEGEIVGFYNGTQFTTGADGAVDTNVALGTADEHIPVELTGEAQEVMNLKDHPKNVGYTAAVQGKITNYLATAGIKEVIAYAFEGPEPEAPKVEETTIAALNKLVTEKGDGNILNEEVTYTFKGIVTGDSENKNGSFGTIYVMAEDAKSGEDAIVLYNSSFTDGIYKTGDVIEVTLVAGAAKAGVYNDINQITWDENAETTFASNVKVTSTTTVTPFVVSVADLTNYVSLPVTVKDVTTTTSSTWNGTQTFSVNGTNLTVYTNARATFANQTYYAATGDITGIVTLYKSNPQLAPRNLDDIAEAFKTAPAEPEPEEPTVSDEEILAKAVKGAELTIAASDYTYDNGAELTNERLYTDGVILTFANNGGSNAPKWYNNNTFRLYASNAATIKAGLPIEKIEFTVNSGTLSCTPTNGSFSDNTWKAESNDVTEVTFNKTGSVVQISAIKITLVGEGGGTTQPDPDPTPDPTPGETTTTTLTMSDYFSGTETLATAEGQEWTFGDFAFTFTKKNASSASQYNDSDKGIRFYQNDIMKIDGKGKKISKIVIKASSSSYVKNVTADPAGNVALDTSDLTITWTGDAADAVTLTASAQIRFKTIDITWTE